MALRRAKAAPIVGVPIITIDEPQGSGPDSFPAECQACGAELHLPLEHFLEGIIVCEPCTKAARDAIASAASPKDTVRWRPSHGMLDASRSLKETAKWRPSPDLLLRLRHGSRPPPRWERDVPLPAAIDPGPAGGKGRW